MNIQTKKCKTCGKTFQKRINCSKKDWEITFYCSKSCAKKNKPSWNKGKPWSLEIRMKMSEDRLGHCNNSGRTHFKKGIKSWNSGIKMTKEQTKNMHVERPNAKGINHPKWRGGITSENLKIRHSVEYKEWRTKVFERDDYICTICGIKGGWHKDAKQKIALIADHIKPFALFIELRFEVSNGRTLCKSCDNKHGFKWNRHLSYDDNLDYFNSKIKN